MTKPVKFEQFTFDLDALELTKNATRVLLRPKTALLLKVLIDNKQQVMGKRELALSVWGTEHISDQSLFQAMSELRRKLTPLKPIQTLPNRGYRWNTDIQSVRSKYQFTGYLAAASICGVSLILFASKLFYTPAAHSIEPIYAPVAVSAFSKGVQLLQIGRVNAAQEMLQLSVQENPLLNEAQILLAQISLQQGDALTARSQALQLLQDKYRPIDAYTIVSAMDIVSRSEAELGENNAALLWASQAFDAAQSEGFVCTAYDLQNRLNALLDQTKTSRQAVELTTVVSQVSNRALSENNLRSAPMLDAAQVSPMEIPQHCNQMRRTDEETSGIMNFDGPISTVKLMAHTKQARPRKPLI